jgi:hypothetical protein
MSKIAALMRNILYKAPALFVSTTSTLCVRFFLFLGRDGLIAWHKIGLPIDMPSAVIRSYLYYPEDQRLRVAYVSGAVYDYFDVPAEVYAAMKTFQSKDAFLNRQIKGRYAFEKVQ